MDQNMAFYDSIAPTKVVDLSEMATLCEQSPIENFVHEEGMRELTSFHHTEAEFKHSSSKIASKPNFVRTINCDLTRISFMFPATDNHILIIECCTHLHLVCVCVLPSGCCNSKDEDFPRKIYMHHSPPFLFFFF
jgi:hypothetical protein